MKAIKTERSNQVFNPPPGGEEWADPDWVERTTFDVGEGEQLPAIKLTYEVEPNDLVHLNHGARLELMVVGDGMPPVSLGIVPGPPAHLRVEPGPPPAPVPPGPKPIG